MRQLFEVCNALSSGRVCGMEAELGIGASFVLRFAIYAAMVTMGDG